MIELPNKFKQALGNGVRTSLYPLIRIYKGIQIDDDLSNATEIINLSIKETSIKDFDGLYEPYEPLILSSPSLSSKGDIINNKYTISSVSLKISNANYKGKVFSDKVVNYLNSVCQLYYCANGIDSLEDCLLVYTGTIRRYNQQLEQVNLTLEDLTQQKLSTKIPTSTIEDERYYKKEDIGRPYPMVYGYVDKSPVIPKSAGRDDMGELREDLSKFHIDRIGRRIEGLWTAPNENIFGNDYISPTHPLVQGEFIKSVGTLSMWDNGYIPVPQNINVKGWSFYVDGITDPDASGYNKITGADLGDVIYQFEQTDGSTTSASVRLMEDALISVGDLRGIPTRIYRPLDKIECATYCDSNNGDDMKSINRIYGFDNYTAESYSSASDMYWEPWGIGGNIDTTEYYNNNWHEGDQSMWQPTLCNQNTQGLASSAVDTNWASDTNYGLFPVQRLQNGDLKSGIYVCGKNADGAIGSEEKTGYAWVKMILKEGVGSLECSTKYLFDAEAHQHDGMTNDYGPGWKLCSPAGFWIGEGAPIMNGTFLDTIVEVRDNNNFPYMPYDNYHNISGTWEDVSYPNQNSDQDSLRIVGGFHESNAFNQTTFSDSIKFGVMQIKQQGWDEGNDRGFTACQLYNFYLMHDAVISNPLDKRFFADVVGRIKDDDSLITNVQYIFEDILVNELDYTGQIILQEEQNPWLHSFTIDEQIEAKNVFEQLFKASTFMPTFNSMGEFKIVNIHQLLDESILQESGNKMAIDNSDVIKYSFELTKLDDVKNSINIKYKFEYASGEFLEQTGYKIKDGQTPEEPITTYDGVSEDLYPDEPEKHYNIDYYGLKDVDAKLEVESKYIRDESTAKKLQTRLLNWYANQHLIVKLDLPISYINLEVGDYIEFNELLGGKLAFGYDYTEHINKNGQLVYKYFFITKISKSLDKVSIEAVQVHHGQFGFGDYEFEEDDWEDDSDYDDGTIIDEEIPEEDLGLEFLGWVNDDDNVQYLNPISANVYYEGVPHYALFCIGNSEEFQYCGGFGQTEEMCKTIPEIDDEDPPHLLGELDNAEYLNISLNLNISDQLSSITISTDYDIDEDHGGLVFKLSLYRENPLIETDEYPNGDVNIYFTQTNNVDSVMYGDVNNDGIINVLDVVAIVNHILGNNQLEGDSLIAADYNDDGIINVLDVVTITQLILSGGG